MSRPSCAPIPLSALSRSHWLSLDGEFIICDISSSVLRPYLLESFRRAIFDSLHSMSHPGICTTQCLVTCHFVWLSVNTDDRRWARSCLQCQRAKVNCLFAAGYLPPLMLILIMYKLILWTLYLLSRLYLSSYMCRLFHAVA